MPKTAKSSRKKADKNLDARIRRSREALIRAGRELLNQNFETSLSDIARAAEVGRTTLYRLFETKEELVAAIALDCLETFDRATAHIDAEAESAIDAIRLLYRAIMPLAAEMQFLMSLESFGVEDRRITRQYERQQDEMRQLIELARREGSIDRSLPTEWLLHSIDAFYYPAWMLRGERDFSDDRLAELAFRSFHQGAAPGR